MILEDWLTHQKNWSVATFGPGERTEGVIDHIGKELQEIKEDPQDLKEWIDVVILAFDGALRVGYTPEQIAHALNNKTQENYRRKWPDWRTAPKGKAIEHIRD